jgi:hypothetical protein
MNLIKKIGCNQWNVNQSQLDAGRLYNMLQLGQLSSETPFQYHHPIDGISALCKELLNHPKIKDMFLKFCMEEGKTLIIEGIENEVDPMLDPVLEK